MDQQHEPFLPAEDESREKTDHSSSSTTLSNFLARFKTCRVGVLVHTILILLYTVASIAIIRAARNSSNSVLRAPCKQASKGYMDLSHIPDTNPTSTAAIDHLDFAYTPTIFHNLTNNPYAGAPSPALDAAWTALLAPMHIRVSEAELRRDNQQSVELREGGGYLGWMGVFHGLHCIVRRLLLLHLTCRFRKMGRQEKRMETCADLCRAKNMLRKWNYKEHYHSGLSVKEEEHLGSHVGS